MEKTRLTSYTIDGAGIGMGVFFFGAGCLYIAERFHFIPEINWGWPLAGISIGLAAFITAIRQKD